MCQVKTAIIRKLTFLHTFDSQWKIYKKFDKVKKLLHTAIRKH